MKLYAKKSLGQHFLHSKKVLSDIIAAAEIGSEETVLEIGPGTGVLTKALLDAGAKVIAIEKDVRAIDLLKEKFATECATAKLVLKYDDILDFDGKSVGLTNGGYALIANIPYYITGAILEKFLAGEPRPNRMVLLTQKEVTDRIVARDGKESILSISVKAFGIPTMISKIPPGAFVPPPTVDSAILAINHISNARFLENGLEIGRFFEIVRAGFAHKRKFLMRNLENVANLEILKEAWQVLSLDEKIRAEDLTLDQWFALSTKIST